MNSIKKMLNNTKALAIAFFILSITYSLISLHDFHDLRITCAALATSFISILMGCWMNWWYKPKSPLQRKDRYLSEFTGNLYLNDMRKDVLKWLGVEVEVDWPTDESAQLIHDRIYRIWYILQTQGKKPVAIDDIFMFVTFYPIMLELVNFGNHQDSRCKDAHYYLNASFSMCAMSLATKAEELGMDSSPLTDFFLRSKRLFRNSSTQKAINQPRGYMDKRPWPICFLHDDVWWEIAPEGRLGIREGAKMMMRLSAKSCFQNPFLVQEFHEPFIAHNDYVYTESPKTADGTGLKLEQPVDTNSRQQKVLIGKPSKRALALATLVEHPEWSDIKIAESVGCHVKSLYKWDD